MKQTARDILEALAHEVTADGEILLARLLDDDPALEVIPPKTFDVAREVFGDGVLGRRGRIATPLRSKIAHAMRVWDAKYGPLNDEQMDYADDLLAWTIRSGAAYAAAQNMAHAAPMVWTNLQSIVNHERADAGFKSRASATIDVSEEIAEALKKRSDG